MLGRDVSTFEEIERKQYKNRGVWSITLSFPPNLDQLRQFERLAAIPLQYNAFD